MPRFETAAALGEDTFIDARAATTAAPEIALNKTPDLFIALPAA
jgi:hypothetical protein